MITPPFTWSELNDKTVEFETDGPSTEFGHLKLFRHEDGSLDSNIVQQQDGKEVVLDPPWEMSLLIRHPSPQRADFFWAGNVEVLAKPWLE